jgi:hypothetical protein
MNERISELRKQAINFCLDKGSQGNLSEEVSEKFAELIVRECADYVDSAISDGGVDGRSLKEHFGVEE